MSDGVSRETPALALELSGERLPVLELYVDILAAAGVERGLIGPREVPRLWDRHVLNSAVVAPALKAGDTVADVGTGAGLPGLVWSIIRPDISMVLIEPLLRRTKFLEEVIAELGLTNTRVLRSRAEDVDEQFDVVTARAVAHLDKLARWCLPLVKSGGRLLALKGQTADEEIKAARPTLFRLGATAVKLETYGDLDIPTTVVEVVK